MALGDDQFSILDQFAHFQPPLSLHAIDNWHIGAREIVAKQIAGRLEKAHIRFSQRFSIDVDSLVDHAQAVAWDADDALDEMLLGIHWVMKDDHIAARDLLIRHDVIP